MAANSRQQQSTVISRAVNTLSSLLYATHSPGLSRLPMLRWPIIILMMLLMMRLVVRVFVAAPSQIAAVFRCGNLALCWQRAASSRRQMSGIHSKMTLETLTKVGNSNVDLWSVAGGDRKGKSAECREKSEYKLTHTYIYTYCIYVISGGGQPSELAI